MSSSYRVPYFEKITEIKENLGDFFITFESCLELMRNAIRHVLVYNNNIIQSNAIDSIFARFEAKSLLDSFYSTYLPLLTSEDDKKILKHFKNDFIEKIEVRNDFAHSYMSESLNAFSHTPSILKVRLKNTSRGLRIETDNIDAGSIKRHVASLKEIELFPLTLQACTFDTRFSLSNQYIISNKTLKRQASSKKYSPYSKIPLGMKGSWNKEPIAIARNSNGFFFLVTEDHDEKRWGTTSPDNAIKYFGIFLEAIETLSLGQFAFVVDNFITEIIDYDFLPDPKSTFKLPDLEK